MGIRQAAAPVMRQNPHPSDPSVRRRLVFGASGYIGTRLVPRLLAEGIAVRASARDLRHLEGRDWPGVERVAADALVPESLEAALAEVDTAYYLVHSMAAGRGFSALDRRAASHFARAAGRAGVRRIVYLGGLAPAGATSEHVVSRRQTGEILRQGPVPVTELRAGIIVGPGSAAFEVMR
ncbi:MAG TPA: NAD(P)H-binding protein, partial [Pseudohaliea sp.]|nr:NAD(P)H-binding protein [Pseudohaliea sp.]